MATYTNVLLYIVFLYIITDEAFGHKCQRKQFSGSSFVCACNSTFCDVIQPDTRPPSEHFTVYVTDKIENRFRKGIYPFGLPLKAAHRFTINVTSIKQTLLGFGGTFTDATGMNIASLSVGAQENLIETYFGTTGIEYTMGRIPIASNDMSTDIYSYDFTIGDTGLSKFTIAGYDHLYKIPFIDKAVVASPHKVLLFGSPWCSPDWMKSNDNMVGWGTVATNMSKPYANYLARFLSEYEGFMMHGRMWGLTPQSGPYRSCDNTSTHPQYQSLCWTPRQMRDWVVTELNQSLNDAGYDYIKLMVMDDRIDQLADWTETFNDAEAREVIDGFAVHWYNQSHASSRDLEETHTKYPDKFVISSEASIKTYGESLILGSWEDAEKYSLRMLQDMNSHVAAFVDYNMAVNMTGGPSWVDNYGTQSPIVVDGKNDVFYKQPTFYAIGHFSKFVTTGSKGVEVKSDSSAEFEPQTVAFLRPDGALVLVIVNFQNKTENVSIFDGKNYINHVLKMDSINTFIWWP